MRYAIVINLDRDNNPPEVWGPLWTAIEEKMLEAGFYRDGSKFLINLPKKQACALARRAVDAVESHLDYLDKHLPRYITEFYGYNHDEAVNLLVPPPEKIKVRVLRWLGKRPA